MSRTRIVVVALMAVILLSGFAALLFWPRPQPPVQEPPAQTDGGFRRKVGGPAETPGPTPEAPPQAPAQPTPAPRPAPEVPAAPQPAPQAPPIRQELGPESAPPVPREEEKPAPPAGEQPAGTPQAPPSPQAGDGAQPGRKAAPQARAKAGSVRGVEVTSQDGAVTVQVRTAGPVVHYKWFTMDDPPRLVVDLPGRWSYGGPKAVPADSGLARGVRIGTHPDMFRVVVDLAVSKAGSPEFRRTGEGFSVTIRQAGQ